MKNRVEYLSIIFALIFLSFYIFLIPAMAASITDKPIIFCEDVDGFPPYIWKEKNKKKTEAPKGYNVDVIKTILQKHGIKSSFIFLPWKRCLKNVEKNLDVQVVLDIIYTKERSKKFLLTRDLFSTNACYFYSHENKPKGITINSLSDIQKIKRICGRFGSNYTKYGISNDNVIRTAHSFNKLVQLINAGRCDIFLARYEVLASYKFQGLDFFSDGNLRYGTIPGIKPTLFYMGISRKYKFAEELKEILDSGITEMKNSGELDLILQKYIPKL